MKKSGFTLIELLIVIAVLGVLAGGVLVAINPLEKIAKAKDSTKKSTVSQLVNALQSYYTLKGQGTYPPASSTWIQSLIDNGDLKSVPPPAGTFCSPSTNSQNGYCYKTNSDKTEAIVYAGLESSDRPSGTSGTTPYILWSSVSGGSGTYYSVTPDVPDTVTTSGFTSGPASTLTQGLAGWWTMNGNADDSSGNGNNGAITEAVLTTDRNGQINKAYDFDGTNDMIQTGTSSVLNLTSELTYSAWFYIDTGNSGWQRPLQKFQNLSDGNGIPYGIQYGTTAKKWGCEYRNAAQTEYPNIRSGITYDSGSWYHVVCVASKTSSVKFALYVNGALAGSQSTWFTSGDIDSGSRPITFGGARNAGTYWNGKIDDVRIYNRALPASEVSSLFSAGPQ